jgi:acyl dehydratase
MTEVTPRFFEDYAAGQTFTFGDYAMSESEIIAFATAYDPQPFHLQRQPPLHAAHHELIASGWHTAAVTMRLLVDHIVPEEAILPSPGCDELRFHRPVKPEDRLAVRLTVIDARPSQTKPDRGIVRWKVETLNQRGELVMSLMSINFFRRRVRETPSGSSRGGGFVEPLPVSTTSPSKCE